MKNVKSLMSSAPYPLDNMVYDYYVKIKIRL